MASGAAVAVGTFDRVENPSANWGPVAGAMTFVVLAAM